MEDLEEKFLDISNWGPIERAVRFRNNSDKKWVLGEIVGMHIKPDQNFEAEVMIKAAAITVYGTGLTGWVQEGLEPRQYQFIHEPPIVTRLRRQMADKKSLAASEKLLKEAAERQKAKEEQAAKGDANGFVGDMDSEKEDPTLGGGRKGSGRVSAVKGSRLPENS